MADEISDALKTAAQAPKRVRTDAGEAEAHSLADQIAADQYLAAKAAAKTVYRGLRISSLRPGGTI